MLEHRIEKFVVFISRKIWTVSKLKGWRSSAAGDWFVMFFVEFLLAGWQQDFKCATDSRDLFRGMEILTDSVKVGAFEGREKYVRTESAVFGNRVIW